MSCLGTKRKLWARSGASEMDERTGRILGAQGLRTALGKSRNRATLFSETDQRDRVAKLDAFGPQAATRSGDVAFRRSDDCGANDVRGVPERATVPCLTRNRGHSQAPTMLAAGATSRQAGRQSASPGERDRPAPGHHATERLTPSLAESSLQFVEARLDFEPSPPRCQGLGLAARAPEVVAQVQQEKRRPIHVLDKSLHRPDR